MVSGTSFPPGRCGRPVSSPCLPADLELPPIRHKDAEPALPTPAHAHNHHRPTVQVMDLRLEDQREEEPLEAGLGRLLMASPAPSLALDSCLRVRFWSDSAAAASGVPSREALGRPIEDLVTGEARAAVRAALAAVLVSHEPGAAPAAVAMPLEEREGRAGVVFRLAAHRHAGAGGLPPGLFLAGVDATEQQRSVGLLLGSVAHECKTPLNHVMGALQLIAAQPGLEPEIAEYVQIAEKASSHLLKMVQDLVEGAKAEHDGSGGPPLRCEPFDPRALVEDVASASAPAAQAKGVELVARAAEDLPPRVLGDVDRCRQIALNLTSNALKVTSSGHVQISVFANEREIKFEVKDTGPGIPESERPKLFQLFSQTDVTLDRRIPGTGLGLAISQKLAHRMGGAITIATEVGVGSAFTFSMPLHLPSEGSEAAADQIPRTASTASCTSSGANNSGGAYSSRLLTLLRSALVVEPNDAARAALSALLRSRGYSVAAAASAEAAEGVEADVIFAGVPVASPVPAAAFLASALALREAVAGPAGERGGAPLVLVSTHAALGELRGMQAEAAARSGLCCGVPALGSIEPLRRLTGAAVVSKPLRAAELERALRDSAVWRAAMRRCDSGCNSGYHASEEDRESESHGPAAAGAPCGCPGSPGSPHIARRRALAPPVPAADLEAVVAQVVAAAALPPRAPSPKPQQKKQSRSTPGSRRNSLSGPGGPPPAISVTSVPPDRGGLLPPMEVAVPVIAASSEARPPISLRPRAFSHSQEIPTEPHAAALPGLARILVADDNPINVKLLKRFLEKLGYAVETAASGTEALNLYSAAAAAGEPFACLLLDIFMPGGGGCECALGVREREEATGRVRTPIVAVTASSSPSELAAAATAGMDDVLPKPVQVASLAALLNRLLGAGGAGAPEGPPSPQGPPRPRPRALSVPGPASFLSFPPRPAGPAGPAKASSP
eukprot:tig00001208_g7541.t2